MPPLALNSQLVRCQTLWALADASRHHADADLGVRGSPATLAAWRQVHASQLRDALVATSHVATKAYSVTLGQRVCLIDETEQRWDFVVDFLRPTAFGVQQALACSGLRADGARVLLFLGHDALRAAPPVGAAVVHLKSVPR